MGSLALEFTSATPGPGGEELLEVFLVGGQALFETVCRLLVTFAGPQPAEAADTETKGTFTCRETEGHGGGRHTGPARPQSSSRIPTVLTFHLYVTGINCLRHPK